MMKKTWMFVISLLGMAISASGLILFIPSLFRPDEQISIWTLGALTCFAVVFAVGTLYRRPSRSTSD